MSQQYHCLVRFYLDRAGKAVVRMVDAEFEYTYEYQVTLLNTPYFLIYYKMPFGKTNKKSLFSGKCCWSCIHRFDREVLSHINTGETSPVIDWIHSLYRP